MLSKFQKGGQASGSELELPSDHETAFQILYDNHVSWVIKKPHVGHATIKVGPGSTSLSFYFLTE